MPEVSSVNIGMRRIAIHRFTGVVLDSQRSSETRISGGHNNTAVTSTTTHYNEVFLRDAEGNERSAEIGASNIGTRVGNIVTVTWGILNGKESGSYTTVRNHTTQQTGHIKHGINKLAGPLFVNFGIFIAVFAGVFGGGYALTGSFMGLVCAGLTGAFFYWITKRRKELKAAMIAALPEDADAKKQLAEVAVPEAGPTKAA